jgi:hypothetical protein
MRAGTLRDQSGSARRRRASKLRASCTNRIGAPRWHVGWNDELIGFFYFFGAFDIDWPMSDYVEARYALLVLRQASLSGAKVSRALILDLISDLNPNREWTTKRGPAVAALKTLALAFEQGGWPPDPTWQVAHKALEDWCNSADS